MTACLKHKYDIHVVVVVVLRCWCCDGVGSSSSSSSSSRKNGASSSFNKKADPKDPNEEFILHIVPTQSTTPNIDFKRITVLSTCHVIRKVPIHILVHGQLISSFLLD
jgi:hypothetical protein